MSYYNKLNKIDKVNKFNKSKLINFPLYEQYLNEINAFVLPENHYVLYKNNMGIVTCISISWRFNEPRIYLELMAIQEKYKIFYILTSDIYDKAIFDQIYISEYIHELQLTITIKNDIRFIYNNNIKHLSLMKEIDNDIIDDIITNIKIKSLYIYSLHIDSFYKVIHALHNSKLLKLDITYVSYARQLTDFTNPALTALKSSAINLKKFKLPLSDLDDIIIDALLENIKKYSIMKKIRLYGTLTETASTILGYLIVNSSLTHIKCSKCIVNPSMWQVINNPIYKNSYELYEPLALVLPVIHDWITVRDMLNNNIRINNLIIVYNWLNTYNSTLFAEGLLNNKVINSLTFDLIIDINNPTDYKLIFSNIINRNIHMEYLYFTMFYFYPYIKNEINFMLDNNWLKVLYINDNYLEYVGYDLDHDNVLHPAEIIEIISHISNNTSLTNFYFNAGNQSFFSEDEINDITIHILDNNFTLLECDIRDQYNLYIPAIIRNNINKLRKNVKLEELMYNAVDNTIYDSDETICKDFINPHIIDKYKK